MEPVTAYIINGTAYVSRDDTVYGKRHDIPGFQFDVELDTYNMNKALEFAAELVESGIALPLSESPEYRRIVNPHPTETDDTVICAGCGHEVDSLNDLASIPDPADGTQMIVWHVDCETELLEEQRLEIERAEEEREEGPMRWIPTTV
jgi:hypothetical protein